MRHFLFAAVAALVLSTMAQAVTIDNFAEPVVPATISRSTLGTTNVSQTGLNPTNTVGGVREVSVTASLITNAAVDNVSVDVGGGVFDYASTSGADGSAMLFYDGNAGGVGNLNLDLTNQALAIEFVLSDSAQALPVTVTLDDGTNTASVTQNLMAQITPGDPSVTLFFNASQFQTANPAIDLSSINTVKFSFDPAVARDFRLGSGGINIVQEVPEPTSLAVWGVLSAAGMWYGHRRLRRRQAVAS